MKKIIILITCLIGITEVNNAQDFNVNGRFSSSLYSFQRFDTTNVSGNYLESFQMLNLNFNYKDVSLRSYMNLVGDIEQPLSSDPTLRFYNLFLEVRNIFNAATIKLGRQPLFNSVAGGLFDGVNLDLKKGDYKLNAYYGTDVPAYQKFEIRKFSQWKNNYVVGGDFSTVVLHDFQLGLSYINKNYQPEPYWATRLDASLNPIQVLIENNSLEYQFASAEVNYDYKDKISINTRYDYDLNYDQTSKVEFDGNYSPTDKLTLDLYYNFRNPIIRYNSIFSVFDYGNTQEYEVGANYELNSIFTLNARYGDVVYQDANSQRVTVGLTSNYGSISYRRTFGYAGELDALSVYGAYTVLKGLLTPSLGVTYTAYKLSESSDLNNLTAILAGVNCRPLPALSFDLQAQYMNNRIYQNDFRMFFKINYWFNTNF